MRGSPLNRSIVFLLFVVVCAVPVNASGHQGSVASGTQLRTGSDGLKRQVSPTDFPMGIIAQGENKSQDSESGDENSDSSNWDDEDFDFDEGEMTPLVRDPLAPFNKAMFQFNDKLYFWVLKPVAKGYRTVVPTIVRTAVKNFSYNLASPLRFISCLLQGKVHAAGGELVRVMANSTVGLLGILDVTQSYPELNPDEEDLGQAFGVWGIGNGFYLVLPFLGPSTLRDAIGWAAGLYAKPTTYVKNWETAIGLWAFDSVNTTSFRIGDYETLKNAAIEPYEAFRDAYIQYRNKELSK